MMNTFLSIIEGVLGLFFDIGAEYKWQKWIRDGEEGLPDLSVWVAIAAIGIGIVCALAGGWQLYLGVLLILLGGVELFQKIAHVFK